MGGLPSKDFFSTARNYDYGISANYTNDLNQLEGSIAVYSLNFAQPASDYLRFRQRISENSLSLENVLLNRFQINGTIKVRRSENIKIIFNSFPSNIISFKFKYTVMSRIERDRGSQNVFYIKDHDTLTKKG
jgi:hypothetical protein